MTTLHIITGPTAVGKTEAALEWAEKNKAEILSCDSVCVYRGMNIGSAKPTLAQQKTVPHYGIDLVEPTQRFSVAQFISYAQSAIREIQAKGKNVCITGGSGFYLAAFFGPVTDELPISEAVIEEVRALQKSGADALRQRLHELEGPTLPSWLDQSNPIRLSKALERRLSSPLSLDALRDEFLTKKGPFADYRFSCELLERPDDELKARIHLRTDEMLRSGLVTEAESLLKLGLDPELPSARAVGYRETMDWIRNDRETPIEALSEHICLNTWALVKKQRKWFRRLGIATGSVE
jgi:tRNA dimethylallyltransferase